MVFGSLKALVYHVEARRSRTHAQKSGVRPGPQGEEGFADLLVSGGGGRKAKARDHSAGGYGGEQTEALILSQTVGPANVSVTSQPAPLRFASLTGIAELWSAL